MRKYSKSWVGCFGANASVQLPSWGNIVYGVPVRSMDLTNLSKKEGIIKQILADNYHHWTLGAEITHIGWLKLSLQDGQKGASIVIKYTTPEAANSTIANETIWNLQSC
jgi:hypothetical protein